jgi:hypothetical protein
MGCKRYACELKLAKQVVILGHGLVNLIYLNEHNQLVIRVGSEVRVCLVGMVVLCLMKIVMTPTVVSMPRERGMIQEQQILSISRLFSR